VAPTPRPSGGPRDEAKAKTEQEIYQQEVRKLVESLRKSAHIDIRL
jgi:hypothetical protein